MHGAAVIIKQITIPTTDGYALGATVFEPERGPPRGTLIIHGGAAILQRFYREYATAAATKAGLRAITYDYRGIGRSRPKKPEAFATLDVSMTSWAKVDATAVIRFARSQYPGRLFMLGHSFGGQMIGLADEWREADAAILVASQLAWWGHWSGLERWRLAAVWAVIVPALAGTLGYLPGSAGLGVDLPGGVASEWASWCRHPYYLGGYHADARERFERFDRPTMFFSFTDDDYAPGPAVDALRKRLKKAPVVERRIDPSELAVTKLGHFGFFRGDAAERLWEESFRFLEDPVVKPPPSEWLTEEDVMADLNYGRSG